VVYLNIFVRLVHPSDQLLSCLADPAGSQLTEPKPIVLDPPFGPSAGIRVVARGDDLDRCNSAFLSRRDGRHFHLG
jgi:hypothetical protein